MHDVVRSILLEVIGIVERVLRNHFSDSNERIHHLLSVFPTDDGLSLVCTDRLICQQTNNDATELRSDLSEQATSG